MSVWLLAFRNIGRNRRRSLLAGAVIVLGFAAFALAGGFMAQTLEGLREGTIRSGVGHLQLARPAAFEPGGDASLADGLPWSARMDEELKGVPGVVEVLPRVVFVGLLTNGTRSVPFLGTGLDPEREARTMDHPSEIAGGRWLRDRSEHAVVLGVGLARSLGVGVGDEVTLLATSSEGTLDAVDATVAGLADIPVRELSDRFLAAPIDLARTLLGVPDRVSTVVVVLEDHRMASRSLPELRGRLAVHAGDVVGKTWEQLAVFYRQVRLLYFGIFGFMGAVLVAVVLLATANTMLMSVSERIREIGTLRAVGTRPGFIRRLLMTEGVALAAIGCIAGTVLALVVRAALNHSGIVLPPPPGVTHGAPLHVKIYGLAYAVGAISMIATAALASYLPARRAARMSIVEALAHV